MPELPEVETITRELKKTIVGRKIEFVKVLDDKPVRPQSARVFKDSVEGKKIKNVSRRGKLIMMALDENCFLAIHLKLTGQLVLAGEESPYLRVKFVLDNGQNLYFNDLRKFGFTRFLPSPEAERELRQSFKFGPEPFDISFTPEYLAEKINSSRRAIKTILLDQKIVAGLGNIYVDEILFLSGIKPDRRGPNITLKEIKLLHRNIEQVLKKAIKAGGSSSQDYFRLSGEPGEYQKYHYVYRRKDKGCLKCSGTIKRMVVGGRGTHYCSNCQT